MMIIEVKRPSPLKWFIAFEIIGGATRAHWVGVIHSQTLHQAILTINLNRLPRQVGS
jgi:hypothetical protein